MKNLGISAFNKSFEQVNSKEKSNKSENNNIKRIMESGDTILVRFPSPDSGVYTYQSHNAFVDDDHRILPNACHKINGVDDLYDKVAEYLVKEANKVWDPENKEPYKVIRQKSNQFEPKLRALIGGYDVDTGEPLILDLAGKYAKSVIDVIEESKDDLHETPFKIKRSGAKAETNYQVLPMRLNKLTDAQKANFENAPGEFDPKLFEGALYFKSEEDQLADIKTMAEVLDFDVSAALGEASPLAGIKDVKQPVAEASETEEMTADETDVTPMATDVAVLSTEELDALYNQVTQAGFEDKELQSKVILEVEKRIKGSEENVEPEQEAV